MVRPSTRELLITIGVAFVVTPFFFVTFFVLPMMGQITVGFAAIITALYLFVRRSVLVTAAVLIGISIFSLAAFSSIQAIKYRLDIPLFICLTMGVPVTVGYCIFVSSRIWVLKGGE